MDRLGAVSQRHEQPGRHPIGRQTEPRVPAQSQREPALPRASNGQGLTNIWRQYKASDDCDQVHQDTYENALLVLRNVTKILARAAQDSNGRWWSLRP